MRLIPVILLLLICFTVSAEETARLVRLPQYTVKLHVIGETVASEEISINAPDVWDAKIRTILPEGSMVKSGEVVVQINAEAQETWMKELSVEVQRLDLELIKTEIEQKLKYNKQEFALNEKETGLSVQKLSYMQTEAGSDTREIEKLRIEKQILDRQIDFSISQLAKEKRMLEKGFISALQLSEQEKNLANNRIDLKIQQSNLSYQKSLPTNFQLFKANTSLEKIEADFEQGKKELEFMLKNQKVQLKSRKTRMIRQKSRLDQTASTISKCTLHAETSGLYMHPPRSWWGGELAPGSRVNWGGQLGTIINPSDFQVKCKVLDMDIEKVHIGQKTIIYTETETITGEIIFISKLAQPLYSGIKAYKAYDVKIAPERKLNVVPNQKVRVEIIVAECKDVFRIPVDYLSRDGDVEFIKMIDNRKISISEVEHPELNDSEKKGQIILRDFNFIYYSDKSLEDRLDIVLE